jgi:hypothetical protein
MSTAPTWQEANAAITTAIRDHPAFPRVVREVAVAESPSHPRMSWLRRNSRTFGSWTTKGQEFRRAGNNLSRRAWLFAGLVAADLELWPGAPPREAAARVYVEARHCVRHREAGAPPPVLDANGAPVPGGVPLGCDAAMFRRFMAGRVPASGCPHYIAASEARAGFTTCEGCPR